MIEPAGHIDKARRLLDQARHLLSGGFTDGAGRDAYLAALQAALAYVVRQTRKEPKTHGGVRSEYARLARDEPRLDQAYTTVLGRGFGLKVSADYDDSESLTAEQARGFLTQAAHMVEAVAALLDLP